MGIFDLFSTRQKKLRGEAPDVFIYDQLPENLRIQLVQIFQDAYGRYNYPNSLAFRTFDQIHRTLCREYGQFELAGRNGDTPFERVANFALSTTEIEKALDVFELCLAHLDNLKDFRHELTGSRQEPEDAIAEANYRFRQHGIGYEYASGEIIRIDSQLIHSEVVRPTLGLLADNRYSGANDEFLRAHEHYRHGRHKECLVECLKAFESTMKSICTHKNWPFDPKASASALIQTCISNGLFPSFMQTNLGSLRSILESGVPTIRSKKAAHGQGPDVTTVDEATVKLTLNLTASQILFLIESANNLK